MANADLELLRYNKFKRFGIKTGRHFKSFPARCKSGFRKTGLFFKKIGVGIGNFFKDLVMTFVHGSWKTRVSYLVMGFGNITRKQFARGFLFLAFEIAFIVYMSMAGGYWLGKLTSLGTQAAVKEWDDATQTYITRYYDNSFKILLYGVLTIFFIIALIVTWYLNVKQNANNDKIEAENRKLAHDKDDLRALVDRDFYKTLLALPTVGILVFTVFPIIFMILVAFTNYDSNHQPPQKLFGWVGWANFLQLFTWNSGSASFSACFGEILVWTFIWAFFATFTNYFLGMLVAMLINKKGVKLKKVWRTILVLTITIPQFISLLYISKMFGENGLVNSTLQSWGWITGPIYFWKDATLARITVIIINIWVGIPYLMLMVTGLLMNIPADLYESAKIDGANGFQQYTKITLPYILFVTGPYLLTSFIGNMNNFNVIYLLTGGGPTGTNEFSAGSTDLLITWLYKLTVSNSSYDMASVIGVAVFIVVAILSLIAFNLMPSSRNEEDFQ
jgi:arabinogalactan oligomer/maltooligosaccharide transport system permease protein